MQAFQIHLALTHVPVILSIVGLVLLLVGMIQKNGTLIKTAFSVLLVGGLFAVPVYLTGDGAEEVAEQLPDVSESIIERHEEMGKNAFTVAVLVALLSFLGLLFFNSRRFNKFLRPLVLLAALVSAGVMAYTAHLGGQVRHTELRPENTPAPPQQTENQARPGGETDEE